MPLELVHETDAEREAGDGLQACGSSDGASTMIVNNSDFIWVIPDLEWAPEDTALQDIKVQAFRQAISQMGGGLALHPGGSVLLSSVPPEGLYITVDESAQGAWTATSAALFLAEEKLGAALSAELVGNSKAGAALTSCALFGYGAGEAIRESQGPQAAFDAWLGVVGTGAGAAACASAVDEALSAHGAAPTATTADDLLRLADRPVFVATAGETLHLSVIARGLRKIVTRGHG